MKIIYTKARDDRGAVNVPSEGQRIGNENGDADIVRRSLNGVADFLINIYHKNNNDSLISVVWLSGTF